jgi:glycosyltransferase involved in cell wall biosynthesis
MSKVSVIIPAKNEQYLPKTIQSVLSAAKDEIEVIVVLDGSPYDFSLIRDCFLEAAIFDDPRINLIYHNQSVGQRAATNEAARIAKGKYIMKLDGHCMLDEGFDVKLQENCEPDWTVIPRLYQLDAETWQPKKHKKTDFMFIRSPYAKEHPFRIDFWDARTYRAHKEIYKAYRKAEYRQGTICDVMASLGACWFMEKDRFWQLGGLDENHAHWGQMGVEIACKSWLSGGRQVVNKMTWYAHLWRRKPPWKLLQKDVDKSREYSIDLWTNNKWPGQTRDLHWLIDKFWPIPTWDTKPITWRGRFEEEDPPRDLTLLYYTSNRIKDHFRDKVLDQLKHACPDTPIVSVSQKPMTLGENICVGNIGRSLQNIYKQVLTGAKQVKTEYVALVEDDTLYVSEHFNHRPKDCFAYNLNRWCLHQDLRIFSYRRRPILSQCIAPTKLLIECLEPRMHMDVPKELSGEMGMFEKQLGIKEFPYETFETQEPNVVVCHNKNTSGRKYQGKDAEPREEVPPWGKATDLLHTLELISPTLSGDHSQPSTSSNSESGQDMPQFNRSAKRRSQHSYIGSIIFPMEELMRDILEYRDRRRTIDRAIRRLESQPPFIRKILAGEEFTDEKLIAEPYYACLRETHLTGHSKSIRLMRDMIRLALDIKANGVQAPIDMWREGTRLVLHRGWRRVLIMNELGYDEVCARIFKTKEIFQKYNPSAAWSEGKHESDSIHGIAINQFVRLGHKATDKYWVHGYTRLYDRQLAHFRDKKVKVLEIGVLRGASLLLWKDAFPRGRIYGIDKRTAVWKPWLAGEKRIKVFVGHQENLTFLKEKVIPSGPFDVIIDDGGHRPEQQIATFKALWPHVAEGGQFVIEDLHGNYWHKRAPNGPLMMDEIKKKIDDTCGTNKSLEVRSLSAYYNICFIEKM